MNLTIVTDPTKKQIADFHRGLDDYNSRFVANEFSPVRAVVTDDADQVIAGIDCIAHWGKLHVDILWVHSAHRRKGLGRRLVAWAEEQARAMDSGSVVVNTMSFQAPGFYLKLGYTQFGQTENYEGGHSRLYYEKDLYPDQAESGIRHK